MNLVNFPDLPISMYRFDLVIDASDNVATRYLLNDACVILNIPLVSGSALRFEGQVRLSCFKLISDSRNMIYMDFRTIIQFMS